jgi:hypothetical protein
MTRDCGLTKHDETSSMFAFRSEYSKKGQSEVCGYEKHRT